MMLPSGALRETLACLECFSPTLNSSVPLTPSPLSLNQVPMTAPVRTRIVAAAGPFCKSKFTVSFFVPPKFQVSCPNVTSLHLFVLLQSHQSTDSPALPDEGSHAWQASSFVRPISRWGAWRDRHWGNPRISHTAQAQ